MDIIYSHIYSDYYKEKNERNKKIFTNDITTISNNFILFHTSKALVKDSKIPNLNELISFYVTSKHLKIYRNNKSFAYFYNNYYYNRGISDLLLSSYDYDKFRFHITYENLHTTHQLKLIINLYMDKNYLLELFEKPKIPELLSLIINDTSSGLTIKNNNNNKYNIDICFNEDIKNEDYLKYIDLKLFNYQKNNVKWMKNIEIQINNKLNKINFINYSGYSRYYIESIDEYIYYDNNNKLLNLKDNMEKQKEIYLNGGILCDEVGLGKTLSLISLILSNPMNNYKYPIKQKRKKKYQVNYNNIKLNENESKATLIIVPNRLCNQWHDEINKYVTKYQLKILKITTITQFKKYKLEDYQNADIILMGFNFLANERYLNKKESEIRLDKIYWYRLIIDEGHEILIDGYIKGGRKINTIKNNIYLLKSKYRWVCTGTPQIDKKNMKGLILFFDTNLFNHRSNLDHGQDLSIHNLHTFNYWNNDDNLNIYNCLLKSSSKIFIIIILEEILKKVLKMK